MLNFARVLTFLLGQIPKSQKSPSATRTSLGSIYSPFPSHNFPLSFVISPQNFETWTTTSSAHHTLCFYFITLLSVYACHHVHTIHAMFIASSIHVVAHLCYLFIWHFVVPWLHKATVMFASFQASRILLHWKYQNIPSYPTWTWTKSEQQTGFILIRYVFI